MRMKKGPLRLLSVFITAAMLLAQMPVAFAADPASSEQFSLAPGDTYYFDLSAQGIPGTTNTALPDSSLKWVPFTYVGTVNAYSLDASSNGSTTASYAAANPANPANTVSDRSLFVSDYNLTYPVSWAQLNSVNLIFGKNYNSSGVSYKLRSLSVGSGSNKQTGEALRGTPVSNEWDQILDKNATYIKNIIGLSSLGQDTDSFNSSYRAFRGFNSARFFQAYTYSVAGVTFSFRPVLEILNPDTLGTDGLKTVTFDMGDNGTLGNGSMKSAKVVYTGSLTLPEITAENGFNFTGSSPAALGWYDGSTFYAPGTTISLAADTTLMLGYGGTAPTITTTALDDGTMGEAYSETLSATGDMPIAWSIQSGSLPTGLSLNASTGDITDMPTKTGTFNFTVRAANGAGSDTQELTITVIDPDIATVAGACTNANSASYSDMTQAEATDESVIATALKSTAEAAIGDGSVFVTINKINYTVPVAGTSANPSGADGSYVFTVTVSKGSQSQITVQKTITITATAFLGITDEQAVAAAKTAVIDGSVNVAYGATQEEKTAAVQAHVNDLLSTVSDAAGVTATVIYNSGTGKYDVALSKGSASDSKSLSMTVNESAAPDTTPPTVSPISCNYDLSVPADVTTTIAWNSAASVADVVYSVSPDTAVYTLNTGDYTVSGNDFNIKNSFFSDLSLSTGAVLKFDITFNTGATVTLTVSIAAPVAGYTVTASAGSGGSISPSGGVNVTSGGSQTFSITPNSGYRINTVTVDGFSQGAISTYTFTNVTANHTINATFTRTSGGGGGGRIHPTPSTPEYKAYVDTGSGSDATLPVTVDKDSGGATVDVGACGNLMSGGNTTVVTVPSVPGVDTYTLGVPVPNLTTLDEQGEIVFKTDYCSVIVPSNMLTGVEGISGSKAQISIGQGDKSNITEAVKAAVGDRPLVRLSLGIDGKQTAWRNPDTSITVSIPYTPTASERANPESIVIWYIDGSGNAVSVPNGHYDPATGTVIFTTTHFSNYAVGYNRVRFKDVAETAWYSDAVDFIAARGITTGTGNRNFTPAAKLTRGQFLVMLMKAYGITADTGISDNFADAGNTYYTGYLAAAKRLGISGGVGNNMFMPDKEITRQEMFTLLYNALKTIDRLPEDTSGKQMSSFSDAGQIADWATDAMTLMVERGTISGSGSKLSPAGSTTRAEMAQVLYNLLVRQYLSY